MITFEAFLQTSLISAAIIGLVLLAALLLGPRFAPKYRRFIWLLLAIRLIVPLNFSLPEAPVTVRMPDLQAPVRSVASSQVPPSAPVRQVAPLPESSAAPTYPSLLDILLGVWVAVAALLLLHEGAGYVHMRRKIRRWGRNPGAATSEAFDALRAEMGLHADVRLRVYGEAKSPLLLGLFRPLVVLPHEDYAPDELRIILCHELTHFARHDIGYKLLQLLARTLHWFNPLVHLMFRQADVDLEFACDDAVLRQIGPSQRRAYGEAVLAAASASPARAHTPALSTHFNASKKNLARRIRHIMTRKTSKLGIAVLLTAALLLVMGGALIGFATETEAPPPSSDEMLETLLEFCKPAYKDMTVSDFRKLLLETVAEDEEGYRRLLDDPGEVLFSLVSDGSSDYAVYIFHELALLLEENSWKSRTFFSSVEDSVSQTRVEYGFIREILDPDQVTLREIGDPWSMLYEAAGAAVRKHFGTSPRTIDEEAMFEALHEVADSHSTAACVYRATSMKISYSSEITGDAAAIAWWENANAILPRLALVNRNLSIAEYEEEITRICEENGTDLFALIADVTGKAEEGDPLYDFLMGSLDITASKIFADTIGGEEFPYATGRLQYLTYHDESVVEEARADLLNSKEYMTEAEWEEAYAAFEENVPYLRIKDFYYMNYVLPYTIADASSFTVAERDARLDGIIASAQQRMDAMTEEELASGAWQDTIKALLEEGAKAQSDEHMTIEFLLQSAESHRADEEFKE